MNLNKFHMHSGGARGADQTWDQIGQQFGLPKENIHHWRPEHYDQLDDESKKKVTDFVKICAAALGRPTSFAGVDLVKRNIFQVENADAIFAIGRIVNPGRKDSRGFLNQTSKQIVEGGTGWAVEMAIQLEKPLYVYDMDKPGWFLWSNGGFTHVKPPVLTQCFAGIGSRKITERAIQAIRDIYQQTINQ